MEVFVAFSMDEEVPLLEQTCNAWAEYDWAEPNIIQVPPGGKFEIQRRVLADNLSKGTYYILADLGCVPEKMPNPTFMQKTDGLIGFYVVGHDWSPSPTGARICQKGIVTKWPSKRTDRYDAEHAEAVKLAGKRVYVCLNTTCKLLQAS